MRLVIDDKIPYIRPYATRLGKCRFLPGAEIGPQDVKDADVLIVRTRTRINKELLAGSSVRLVVSATIGYDHIDTDWLRAAGISWTNCPGCNATSVAQYVSAAISAAGRDVRVVGIVGCGHVGSAVRDALLREGREVLVSDPPLGLHADLSQADCITYHVPLTREGAFPTYHMADATFFSSLSRRPMIINAARGGVVDEQALLQAMDEGLVGAVVIDTWEAEPTPNPQLLERAAIATPHIAGYSANGKANATLMALRAVCNYFHCHLDLPASPEALLRASLGELPELPPYDPRRDSEALKHAPELFESLRGNYPLRLE